LFLSNLLLIVPVFTMTAVLKGHKDWPQYECHGVSKLTMPLPVHHPPVIFLPCEYDLEQAALGDKLARRRVHGQKSRMKARQKEIEAWDAAWY